MDTAAVSGDASAHGSETSETLSVSHPFRIRFASVSHPSETLSVSQASAPSLIASQLGGSLGATAATPPDIAPSASAGEPPCAARSPGASSPPRPSTASAHPSSPTPPLTPPSGHASTPTGEIAGRRKLGRTNPTAGTGGELPNAAVGSRPATPDSPLERPRGRVLGPASSAVSAGVDGVLTGAAIGSAIGAVTNSSAVSPPREVASPPREVASPSAGSSLEVLGTTEALQKAPAVGGEAPPTAPLSAVRPVRFQHR